MSTELALYQPPVTGLTHDDMDPELTEGGGNFNKALRLFSPKSGAVAEGKVGVNCFGIADSNDIRDLGKTVDLLPVAWRPQAVYFDDSKKPHFAYRRGTPEWEDVKARGDHGMCFLCVERSTNQCVEFHCKGSFQRPLGAEIAKHIGDGTKPSQPITLTATTAPSKHGPQSTFTVAKSSLPFTEQPDDYKAACERFVAPLNATEPSRAR